MPRALVVIDIQKDYFPGGRMELVGAEAASRRARVLLDAFRSSGEPLRDRENGPRGAVSEKADAQRDLAMKEAEAERPAAKPRPTKHANGPSSNTNFLSENRPPRYITPTTGYVQRALA